MEELWAFNEEEVARSIFRSNIPVISAVGHETDFTIADFTADVRAETPTAAAEMAVPDTDVIMQEIKALAEGMRRDLDKTVRLKQGELRLLDPERTASDLQARIALEHLKADRLAASAGESLAKRTALLEGRLSSLRESLEASDPRRILARGYSVVTDGQGNIIKSAAQIDEGDRVGILTGDGSLEGNITDIVRGQ